MFVVLISFPPIKAGKDAAFREWFAATNEQFSTFKGFIRRRLLKPLKDGNYAAIVEFDNREAFEAMHSSPASSGSHGGFSERRFPTLFTPPSIRTSSLSIPISSGNTGTRSQRIPGKNTFKTW
jgi:heme-degrading monooxygenase HmoA